MILNIYMNNIIVIFPFDECGFNFYKLYILKLVKLINYNII